MKNGFNFYPLSDNNFGFVFIYGPKIPLTELGSKAFQVRYNKHIGKWYVGNFYR